MAKIKNITYIKKKILGKCMDLNIFTMRGFACFLLLFLLMVSAISRKFIIIVIFVITAALPGVLCAATYYVAPDGDDGNPGTIEAPFATVKKGS
jgi:glucan phosphoethanolaminetransferase (alkaline phosphatase superfamily)